MQALASDASINLHWPLESSKTHGLIIDWQKPGAFSLLGVKLFRCAGGKNKIVNAFKVFYGIDAAQLLSHQHRTLPPPPSNLSLSSVEIF